MGCSNGSSSWSNSSISINRLDYRGKGESVKIVEAVVVLIDWIIEVNWK